MGYTYDDKYIAEFNFRYDGTSRFPSHDRFVFNPSGSLAWVVSKENFWEPVSGVMNYLKFRASYGQLGNQDVGAYAHIATMGSSTSAMVIDGALPVVVGAPGLISGNLTWEKVRTLDFGVDMGFLNNRLTFEGDVYRRDTKGMLTGGQVLPAVLGTDVPNENAADLKTIGWEFNIGWSDHLDLAGEPFFYSFAGNLSDAQAEITKFANPTGRLPWYFQRYGNFNGAYYEGMKLGEIWGLEVDGLYGSDTEAQSVDASEILCNAATWPAVAGSLKYVDQDGDRKISLGKKTLSDHGDLRKIVIPPYVTDSVSHSLANGTGSTQVLSFRAC